MELPLSCFAINPPLLPYQTSKVPFRRSSTSDASLMSSFVWLRRSQVRSQSLEILRSVYTRNQPAFRSLEFLNWNTGMGFLICLMGFYLMEFTSVGVSFELLVFLTYSIVSESCDLTPPTSGFRNL